ncbi:MAG TPA: fumarate hydratase, partial [Tepidiformaceae bacterium]|nr:fumarate hydratase [Tepidiformaceae bacterium]
AEQSAAAKDAIAQILTNSRMCAEGHRPICQDTGIVVAFVKVGMDVRWSGATMSVADMVNEGVRRAYNHPNNPLRASILADPAGTAIEAFDAKGPFGIGKARVTYVIDREGIIRSVIRHDLRVDRHVPDVVAALDALNP